MKAVIAAYIAGIMDGEGCFLIERFATKRSPIGVQYRSSVQVTMCDRDPIKFISDATDRHIQVKKLPSGRTAYTLVWRNSFAVSLIKAIRPYLIGKAEQADILLDYEATIAPGRGRTYRPEDKDRCEAAREKLFTIRRVPQADTPRC